MCFKTNPAKTQILLKMSLMQQFGLQKYNSPQHEFFSIKKKKKTLNI